MKIDERNGVLDAQLGGLDPARPEAGGKVPLPATPAGDRVSVSDTARHLAGARTEVGDVDAVREERVAGLRAAIDQGQYRPDLHQVARSVLREVVSDIFA